MAGTNPNFNATAFRQAVKDTMRMGLPTTVQERATFRWIVESTYDSDDRNNRPYDYSANPITTNAPEDVQVDVAVEFKTGPDTDTYLGQINNTRAVITVLDVDFDDIEGANQVLLGGNTYDIDYWAPPIGLFDVTIYQGYCVAVDES